MAMTTQDPELGREVHTGEEEWSLMDISRVKEDEHCRYTSVFNIIIACCRHGVTGRAEARGK